MGRTRTRWWLLAIVPLAALLIAVVVGVVLNRRRRDDRAPIAPFDDEFEDHDDDADEYDDLDPAVPMTSNPDRCPSSGRGDDAPHPRASMWAMPADRGGAGTSPPPRLRSRPVRRSGCDRHRADADRGRTVESGPIAALVADHDQVDDDEDDEHFERSRRSDDLDEHDDHEDATTMRDDVRITNPRAVRRAAGMRPIQIDEPALAQTSFRLATRRPGSRAGRVSRSRPTPRPGCTGHRAAGVRPCRAPKSGSPVRNSR